MPVGEVMQFAHIALLCEQASGNTPKSKESSNNCLHKYYTVGLMEPREDTPTPSAITFLAQDEVRRLFAVIIRKRDRALFQRAYHHGLRASEVSLLQRADVHEQQGRISIPRVKGSMAKTS